MLYLILSCYLINTMAIDVYFYQSTVHVLSLDCGGKFIKRLGMIFVPREF